MNRSQSKLFAIVFGILSAFFYFLRSGWNNCTIGDVDLWSVICVVKHTIYGSFGIVFSFLTIAFIISMFLATKENK